MADARLRDGHRIPSRSPEARYTVIRPTMKRAATARRMMAGRYEELPVLDGTDAAPASNALFAAVFGISRGQREKLASLRRSGQAALRRAYKGAYQRCSPVSGDHPEVVRGTGHRHKSPSTGTTKESPPPAGVVNDLRGYGRLVDSGPVDSNPIVSRTYAQSRRNLVSSPLSERPVRNNRMLRSRQIPRSSRRPKFPAARSIRRSRPIGRGGAETPPRP